MPDKYRLTFQCAEKGCGEKVTYGYDTRRDQKKSYDDNAKSPYRCAKHGSRAAEYMTPDNPVREKVFTVTGCEPRYTGDATAYWDGGDSWRHRDLSGMGLGFHADAREFPPGTRLRIAAEILPPEHGPQEAGDACGPSCWTPVACPSCGNPLPPRGRSMPFEWGILDCCNQARMDPKVNPRHLWNEEEARDAAPH